MENWFVPYETSELPAAQKVLILAPHPDDEVFGCGGAAALLQQRGASINVVVLTDGAGYASDDQRQVITRTRQAETNAALAVLGLPPAQFWEGADRGLAADASLHERIAEHLQKVDLVFAPSLTEVHPDHAATGRAVQTALRALIQQEAHHVPSVLFYEVGTPLAPNFLLDITSVWAVKKQAMHCFQSQQLSQDYARHIEGLNAFRTYSLSAQVRYAEAYCLVSSSKLKDSSLLDSVPTRIHGRDAQSVEHLLATADATVETLGTRLITAERQVTESHACIQELSRTLDEIKTALDQQHLRYAKDVAELREAITTWEQVHQSLLNSRSWRLTRPLRWLSEKLSRPR
jgi:LmbE family N-acetylglucosaminyl deacetylase/uncharacterized coiled-coil protein SlyX